MFKTTIFVLIITAFLCGLVTTAANAKSPIQLLPSKFNQENLPIDAWSQSLERFFDVSKYRQVKIQVIYDNKRQPAYLLVYLLSKKYHRVDMAKATLDANNQVIDVIKNYHLTNTDFSEQPGIKPIEANCPDQHVQFIVFAPNDDDFEQQITKDVAKAAELHGFKTVRLLKKTATASNYLNYMHCPNLKGNFYDGDANPELITTVDGVISYNEMNTVLNGQFQYRVTNIWLACQAFNDPMKSAMLVNAQSQKYAAGINDLEVGPSDETAACAMKAAMNNHPMTAAFETCYKELDMPYDQWGFEGKGSDYFGG